ncbi:uncharacterized protein LOC131060575 isoform X2 [Cryptomeria japonica]|uniref:uncharacterized protein LOC131060575 isoform X2 n=1 Tax=Cryptomeria japonica TaxID=3369 RepID=UPI0027DA6145|nr:uncharacterized protein LOC131060575 isoform X2 [Cryptomeria japonica]
MAERRQPLSVIQDKIAETNRGKVTKSSGLKVKQTNLSDRKTLANITNTVKPLPNLGAATPSAPRKDGARAGVDSTGNGKGFTVMVDPELLGNDGVKGRSVQKGKRVEEKKAHLKNVKMGPNPRYEVTEEMKQKADIWALEGIEVCHFTGKDGRGRLVAQALSYRSQIPCWLPSALVEPTEIKDCLKLEDPVEDPFSKDSSSFHGFYLAFAKQSNTIASIGQAFEGYNHIVAEGNIVVVEIFHAFDRTSHTSIW